MFIAQKIKKGLHNQLMLRSLIATSLAGVSLIFAITNAKAANQFEPSKNQQTLNQTLLVSSHQNQADPISYYHQGTKYMNAGQYPQAINYYNQAIQISPNFAEAYHNRGLTYGMAGKYQQALGDLNIAIKLYRQQNNIAESQKAQRIIGLIYEEINKLNNPPRNTNVQPNVNVQRYVDKQMRNWCRNLPHRASVTCYGNKPY